MYIFRKKKKICCNSLFGYMSSSPEYDLKDIIIENNQKTPNIIISNNNNVGDSGIGFNALGSGDNVDGFFFTYDWFMFKQYIKILFLMVIIIMWYIILLTVTYDKIMRSGLFSYFQYFTNWSWSIQTIFYFFLMSGILFNNELFEFMIISCLLPVWGVIWTIYVIVLVLILEDASFILNNIGIYKAGIVFFGNALFHYIPPIILAIVIFILKKNIRQIFQRYKPKNSIYLVFYTIIQIYSPILIMGLYSLIFDYTLVYNSNLKIWKGIIISILTQTVFNGGLFSYFITNDVTIKKNN